MTRATGWIRSAAVVALISLALGCTSVPVQLGQLRNAPHDQAQGRRIRGEACGFMLAGFIPIATHSRAQRALGVMVRESRGDFIDGIEVAERWRYAFVGTLYCTEFSAMAYPLREP